MTQKIFDAEEKDIWDIFPEKTYKIVRSEREIYLFDKDGECFANIPHYVLKINWKDKTEITRPVNYEDMIGCVGWVGNSRDARDRIGILNSYYKGSGYPFETTDGDEFAFFTPVKKSEIKIYGEDK